MMFVSAVVATELLVSPSIPDLLSAMQTFWYVPLYLFLVSHACVFVSKMDTRFCLSNAQMQVFLFL